MPEWFTYTAQNFQSQYGSDWILSEMVTSHSKNDGTHKASANAKILSVRHHSLAADLKTCMFQEDEKVEDCSIIKLEVNQSGDITIGGGSDAKYTFCLPCHNRTLFACRRAIQKRFFYTSHSHKKSTVKKLFCALGFATVENNELAAAKFRATERSLQELAYKIGSHIREKMYNYIAESSNGSSLDLRFRSIIIRTDVELKGVLEREALLMSIQDSLLSQVRVQSCIPQRSFNSARSEFLRKFRR
jgi:hypothetical protein